MLDQLEQHELQACWKLNGEDITDVRVVVHMFMATTAIMNCKTTNQRQRATVAIVENCQRDRCRHGACTDAEVAIIPATQRLDLHRHQSKDAIVRHALLESLEDKLVIGPRLQWLPPLQKETYFLSMVTPYDVDQLQRTQCNGVRTHLLATKVERATKTSVDLLLLLKENLVIDLRLRHTTGAQDRPKYRLVLI